MCCGNHSFIFVNLSVGIKFYIILLDIELMLFICCCYHVANIGCYGDFCYEVKKSFVQYCVENLRKMPIFPQRSKFSLKPLKAREGRLTTAPKFKEEEDVEDFKNIKLKLDTENELHFIDGNWIKLSKKQSTNIDAVSKVLKENHKLEQDKRVLEMKMKIMLNLLTSERGDGEKEESV